MHVNVGLDWFASNRFKVLVVGSKGCGKTKFIERLNNADFEDVSSPNAERLHKQAVEFFVADNIDVKIDLVDVDIDEFNEIYKNASSRQQRHFSGNSGVTAKCSKFLDASGAFVLYDITNVVSFNCIGTIINDLTKLVAPDCDLMLIGTKADLKQLRQVQYQQAESFAGRLGLSLFETSAKTGLNCVAALREMVNRVFEKRDEAEDYISHPVEEGQPLRPSVFSQLVCRAWSCI